jgi:hypothetical protein
MPEYPDLPASYDPTPLGAAMSACEVYCVASCCGMDAYDISVERMQEWANTVTAADVEQARNDVAKTLESLKSAPERFYYLDCEHTRAEVEEWFQAMRRVLAEVQPPV